MKIFISWSGEKSRQVASLLEEWIKVVIQASEPWMSTNIERGALWFSEINEQLASVSLGIICLTAENKEKPWILFEAGALAKGLQSNRVATFLIDLKNEDIGQPLAQFNHTTPNKDGMLQLMNTINMQLVDRKLPQHIFDKAFEKNWPEFDERFKSIAELPVSLPLDKPKRASDDILLELLNTVRSFDKRLQKMESSDNTITPVVKREYQTYVLHNLIKDYIEKGWQKNDIILQLFNHHKVFSEPTLKKMVEDVWEDKLLASM